MKRNIKSRPPSKLTHADQLKALSPNPPALGLAMEVKEFFNNILISHTGDLLLGEEPKDIAAPEPRVYKILSVDSEAEKVLAKAEKVLAIVEKDLAIVEKDLAKPEDLAKATKGLAKPEDLARDMQRIRRLLAGGFFRKVTLRTFSDYKHFSSGNGNARMRDSIKFVFPEALEDARVQYNTVYKIFVPESCPQMQSYSQYKKSGKPEFMASSLLDCITSPEAEQNKEMMDSDKLANFVRCHSAFGKMALAYVLRKISETPNLLIREDAKKNILDFLKEHLSAECGALQALERAEELQAKQSGEAMGACGYTR